MIRKKRPVPVALPPDRAGAEVRGEPDAFARLDGALRALPLDQRAAFVLAEIHGLTHAEVAVIEGVAVGTVKSRTARARERLRYVLRGASKETA